MDRLKRDRKLQVAVRDRLCALIHEVGRLHLCIPTNATTLAKDATRAIKETVDLAIFVTDREIHKQPNIYHLLDMRAQVLAVLGALAAWAANRVDWRIA